MTTFDIMNADLVDNSQNIQLQPTTGPPDRGPLLLLVEGSNDAAFLRRIATVLYRDQVIPSDLDYLASSNRLVFVPVGGGVASEWWNKFAGLGLPEFHLYDREIEPETSRRRELIRQINARRNCLATLTSKRALENYLHPLAIIAAGGPEIAFGDDDNVADVLVHSHLSAVPRSVSWREPSPRTRQRLRYRAKRWLNSRAVSCMTAQWLAELDRAGELAGWIKTIVELIKQVDR
jgi:hypothetical protein